MKKPPEPCHVIKVMRRFGGSFVQALGQAALHADDENLARIQATWPEYWAKYTEVAARELDDYGEFPVVPGPAGIRTSTGTVFPIGFGSGNGSILLNPNPTQKL